MKSLLLTYLPILALLSLTACFGESGDVKEYVAQVKKTSPGKINPLPPAKKLEIQEYSAQNLRSPFDYSVVKQEKAEIKTDDKAVIKAVVQKPRPDIKRPRQFLEKYPLKSLSMVGILKKENTIWGLVEDESGLVHAVKVGDYLGQDSGKIVSISDDEIKLSEIVQDGLGGWVNRDSLMNLRKN